MRYAVVEFFPAGSSPEVILMVDMDGLPIVFSRREEAEEWAIEGNCGTYQILEF